MRFGVSNYRVGRPAAYFFATLEIFLFLVYNKIKLGFYTLKNVAEVYETEDRPKAILQAGAVYDEGRQQKTE